MEIVAGNRISLKDILFGDVWLCSGQSNMEYPMNRLTDRYADVIVRCENSKIWQFKVSQVYDFDAPKDDYSSGNWVAVTPKTILDYSVVAYFFARDLNNVHPQNKEEVGRRLSLAAERLAYHDKKVVASGPIYEPMSEKGNKVELTFTNCGSGLATKDGKN